MWFNEYNGGNIGRITPAGVITEFPVAPYLRNQMAAGPGGNIWFSVSNNPSGPPANPQIAEMTTSGVVTQAFPLPTGTDANLTVGPDGNIWFTEYFNSEIGRITPDGTITQFPAYAAGNIITGPDGNLWFDAATSTPPNSLGRITPAGAVTLFTYPNVGGLLRGLTVGPDGNLWAADNSTGQIDRFNTAGQLTGQWSTPTPNSGPYFMVAGPDGALWFTEENASQIGRITVDGSITEYPTPTPNSLPVAIAKGPDGNLWVTEENANQIGEVVLNQPATTSTSVASSLGSPLQGQAVTFTATVSNTSTTATPAGSVEFYDGSTDLGPGTPGSSSGNQATWTLTTSALPVGNDTITAVYSGTSDFAASQGCAAVTVIPPASLSGTVFEDFNDDGQVDFGENGIGGVTITLTGTDFLGNAVNSPPQLTDSDGAYVFLNLLPGDYTLTETQPDGYVQGTDSVGTAGGSLAATDQFSVSLGLGVDGLN
ncbi:MAG TPA: Ig-like domain repeat protein, partial [Gemmataceae bacterium]|nr:Ig-like domain repeat protein [Gemmataceae bacterium]